MHIVSYRGAGESGGVSRLIQTGIEGNCTDAWWYMNDDRLHCRTRKFSTVATEISSDVVSGHYKYANEFLWPLMHERFDLVRYDKTSHEAFHNLNQAVALRMTESCSRSSHIFVNDYQFALLPSYLRNRSNLNVTHFWHIPWPANIPAALAPQLSEIAKGLLANIEVGFHTKVYVKNFCTFVEKFLPEYKISHSDLDSVWIIGPMTSTRLIVNPAGIDQQQWNRMSRNSIPFTSLPYILSVDRADYSKGIKERIEGIRCFFKLRPELKGKLQFVFICQQTRKGLAAFDEYWEQIRSMNRELELELACENWSPIMWIEKPVSMEELACWYAHARAMLVNPSIDGLNLIAKEYAAACRHPQGSLILSDRAGAWQELKEHVVTISSNHAEAIAGAIITALEIDPVSCKSAQNAMRRIVANHSLNNWWNRVTAFPNSRKIAVAESVPA